jgi:hypothetical protein
MVRSARTLSIISSGIFIGCSCYPSAAFADECKASFKDRSVGNFEFKTAYYEDLGHNGYRDFHTCVLNFGKVDIHAIWYVPGMNSWVLPSELKNYPRRRKDVIQQYMEGCLRYNNVDTPIKAEFSGTKPEQDLANDQVAKNCDGLGRDTTPISTVAQANVPKEPGQQPESVKLSEMSVAFSINFPSNLSNAHDTMLTFAGEASLRPISEQSYANTITYKLSRAEGRPSGDPSAVRMKPLFRGAAERLYDFFDTKYHDNGVQLGNSASRETGFSEGDISYEVKGTTGWVFAPTVFAFVDADNRVLAEMEVPAFAPAR